MSKKLLPVLLLGASGFGLAACGDEADPVTDPLLSIVTTVLPGGSEGVDYRVEVAAAGGSGSDYRWSIASGALPTGVFLRSEGTPSTLITGRPRSGGTSTFELRVRDSNGQEATADLSIVIMAAPPAVRITTTMLPQGSLDQTYSAEITAENGANYAWRIVSGEIPDGLSLSGEGTPSATLSGTPISAGRFTFTLRVTDDEGRRDERQYSVEVLDERPALAIVPAQLPAAIAGVAYRFDFVASGGTLQGYRWSVVSGELPPGLALAEEGTPNAPLSGTPTTRGSFAFRLSVSDSDGNTARQSFFVDVAPAPDPLRIVTFEIPDGRVGQAYSASIRAVNGAGSGYMWSIAGGAPPPGLTLASGTPEATLSGTPTQAGRYAFTVLVTDPIGGSDEQSFELNFEERLVPVAITATQAAGGILDLPDAEGGQPYSATLEATGGARLPTNAGSGERRYHWVVSGGSLPPGVQLEVAGDAVTGRGRLTGIPSAVGSFTATVTVYDRLNQTDSQIVRVAVIPPSVPLVVTTTSLEPLPASGCVDASVTASGGGNSGFSWEVVAGSLPPGVQLERTGTPSARLVGAAQVSSGSYAVTVQVTDSFGSTATRDLTLVVDSTRTGDPRWAVMVGDLDVSNRTDVFVRDICPGGNPAPVRINPAASFGNASYFTRDIALSPRGDALAFIGDFVTDGEFDVYVADLRGTPSAGSAVRVLDAASSTFSALELKWSPDGRKVAILYDATVSTADELWVADVSDLSSPANAVRVSQVGSSSLLDVYAGDYAFSPDGNKIAWVGDKAASSVDELWVVDLSGATPTAPARAHRAFSSTSMDVNGGFLWTPDSRGVVFNADLGTVSTDEIFFTDVSGSGPFTEVKISGTVQPSGDFFASFTMDREEHMAFSPDGTKLFFIGDAVNEGEEDLFLVDYAAGVFSARRAVTNLTTSFATCDSAKWSPDSTRLAVRGDLRSSSQDELFVFDTTGALPVSTNNPLRAGDTTREMGFSFDDDYLWSPDGAKIGFIGDFETTSAEELYLADVSGAPPYSAVKINEPFSSSAQQVFEFRFSPDSSRLAYLSDERSSYDELRVVDISGPSPSRPELAHPAFSSTALDVFQNSDGADGAWFWVSDARLILHGDLETSGCDRAWEVDVSGAAPYLPSLLSASGQLQSCNEDVFHLLR